ncbi:DUF2235 domain-containing protein [Pseudomonas sp. H9]|uniref:DUF2235 domain-containing protein n=1 Tax=Pseudomonas sp. H9 TaxID=483968 RepID=UPI001057ABB9|nr:DUF2235 domain-containing protein [Pseudomonas sp. H9]TDF80254.1 DUF2235 domain-containing protein [Pseudomonas sp. H9]
MPKHLVLFSDGTGNSAGKLFKTNVWRLYQAVDLSDPANPQQPRQFAFYDDGVGTSAFKPLALAGGGFGVGLARNVIDLYLFLCRTYTPGDKIYVFGFSRGAFTVRVLIGLIMTQGLLRYRGNERDLERLAWEAYRAFRRERFPSHWGIKMLRDLRDRILSVRDLLFDNTPYRQAERIGLPGHKDAIQIQFLGLWDTVDAYGLPVDQLTRAIDKFIWPLTMRDYNLSPRVRCARHALALDDERNAFHPRLWNEDPDLISPEQREPKAKASRHIDDERISQVWFCGMHANVGGGYADDSLSYVPLQWIMSEANKHGLRFEASIWNELIALSDENGKLYDSRHGIASYYCYNPRRIDRLNRTDMVRVRRTKVHESVLRRIKVDPDGYAPISLPPNFSVVRIDGSIVNVEQYLTQMHTRQGHAVDTAPKRWMKGFRAAREDVYNTVWRRRVAYFLTLFVSLALVAMPLYAPARASCQETFCMLSKLVRLFDYVLPSFASTWTASFATQPNVFLLLLLALLVCMAWGKRLETRIRDKMRRIWYGIAPLKPSSVAAMPALKKPSLRDRSIQQMRTHSAYKAFMYFLGYQLLPFVFVLAILAGGLMLLGQPLFAWAAASGELCQAQGGSSDGQTTFWFDTRNPCAYSGLQVQRGRTYQVKMQVPEQWRWSDKNTPANPGGYECPLKFPTSWVIAVSGPALRHTDQPWFQTMVRIGANGTDSYALPIRPASGLPPKYCDNGGPTITKWPKAWRCPPDAVPVEGGRVFNSTFTAQADGPLFFYVNEAVSFPFFTTYLYSNNQGCARITVSESH